MGFARRHTPLLSRQKEAAHMAATEHDKLATRLALILVKLNQGETLNPAALAAEFNVSVRTIQRDLSERFSYLPLVKSGRGDYTLEPHVLGHIPLRDVSRFAALAGVRGLFPSLSDEFLRDVFDNRLQSSVLVRGHQYESLQDKTKSFHALEQAIVAHRLVDFDYTKPEGTRRRTDVRPYKLVNQSGVWYLAAQEGDTLKSFAFGRIQHLTVSPTPFTPDPLVDDTLAREEGVWLNPDKKEVVLKVSPEAAGYFTRRKLIAGQVIEKTLEDGGLIVSTKVAHPNQILPIVRYWIPHVRVISPEHLQAELEEGVRGYLGGG